MTPETEALARELLAPFHGARCRVTTSRGREHEGQVLVLVGIPEVTIIDAGHALGVPFDEVVTIAEAAR